MGGRLFTVEKLTVLDTISSTDICTHAQFIPEHTIVLEAGQLLILNNAEFYIDEKKIEGRWVDNRLCPTMKENKNELA